MPPSRRRASAASPRASWPPRFLWSNFPCFSIVTFLKLWSPAPPWRCPSPFPLNFVCGWVGDGLTRTRYGFSFGWTKIWVLGHRLLACVAFFWAVFRWTYHPKPTFSPPFTYFSAQTGSGHSTCPLSRRHFRRWFVHGVSLRFLALLRRRHVGTLFKCLKLLSLFRIFVDGLVEPEAPLRRQLLAQPFARVPRGAGRLLARVSLRVFSRAALGRSGGRHLQRLWRRGSEWVSADPHWRVLPEVGHVDGEGQLQSSHSVGKESRTRSRNIRNILLVSVSIYGEGWRVVRIIHPLF